MPSQRTQWNEATRVQMPALVHLTRIGYTYFGKITENKAGSVYDPDTNILIDVFKEQFARLNPDKSGEADAMLRTIRQELDNDDIGESFYKRLKAVSPVKLIDYDHPEYRNNVTHFYNDALEPFIFMLVARSALNYVEFVKEYFKKDIMADDGLFIMSLGFKLPFRPEDFLSDNVAKYAASPEAQQFIKGIVDTTQKLKDDGIEDSIVLGFNIYFESVKKEKNSDILAAITSAEQANVSFSKLTQVKFSADASQEYHMSDDEFRRIWKYNHAELLAWCKSNIVGFKQDKKFNAVKKIIHNDTNCAHKRRLDNKNPKSASQMFYSDLALQKTKELYEAP